MTTQQFSVQVIAKTAEAIGGSPITFHAGQREIEAHLVEVTPGGSVGRHEHPAICVMYVLEGTIVAELDNGERQTYHAGDVFVEDAHRWVDNVNPGNEQAKFFAVVIGDVDEPKVQFSA